MSVCCQHVGVELICPALLSCCQNISSHPGRWTLNCCVNCEVQPSGYKIRPTHYWILSRVLRFPSGFFFFKEVLHCFLVYIYEFLFFLAVLIHTVWLGSAHISHRLASATLLPTSFGRRYTETPCSSSPLPLLAAYCPGSHVGSGLGFTACNDSGLKMNIFVIWQ